ncbi:protein-L-isoaspartate O-methyltransferase family protein [Acidisoma cladoniae]|jgi:protein-L-isoaspartate(D-aspartate) O-methyltransferase|uniref:protein-L-isoaspartate O-methyltransferase family protein n=1 Tax=Acidisoma cladoniae TaxID=3040935 RepID=UPI00254DD0F5|nr:protein-L-isoaspartate O-methyltransferase [Acidisoma sp. PAMC 29798]
MASTTLPFAAARQMMADSQLRPNKVTNPAVLVAMRDIPRETFLPPALGALAYADQDVRLGDDRVLMSPMAFARLAQLIAPVPGERILVVCGGTGYGAAVLARCGARVTVLDTDAGLMDVGAAAVRALGLSISFQKGDPEQGLPGVEPWDAILIEGAVETIPPVFAAQLRPGQGRLVTVVAKSGHPGVAVLAERQGTALATADMFDCTTTVLPGFRKVIEFQF